MLCGRMLQNRRVLVWFGRSGACSFSWPAGRNTQSPAWCQSCGEPEAPANALPGVDFPAANYAVSLGRSDTEKHQKWPTRKLIFGLSCDNLPNKWGIVNPAKLLLGIFKFQNVAHPSCKSQIESFFTGSRAHNTLHYFLDSFTSDETKETNIACRLPMWKFTVFAAFMLYAVVNI